MKRTTIFADEQLLLEVRDLAARQGTTVTAVVQEALRSYVAQHREPNRLAGLTALFDSGVTDTAERAEEILRAAATTTDGWWSNTAPENIERERIGRSG